VYCAVPGSGVFLCTAAKSSNHSHNGEQERPHAHLKMFGVLLVLLQQILLIRCLK